MEQIKSQKSEKRKLKENEWNFIQPRNYGQSWDSEDKSQVTRPYMVSIDCISRDNDTAAKPFESRDLTFWKCGMGGSVGQI